MANTTTGRGPGPGARRTMTAAARAAAKRAERRPPRSGPGDGPATRSPTRRAGRGHAPDDRPHRGRGGRLGGDPPGAAPDPFEEHGPEERTSPAAAAADGCPLVLAVLARRWPGRAAVLGWQYRDGRLTETGPDRGARRRAESGAGRPVLRLPASGQGLRRGARPSDRRLSATSTARPRRTWSPRRPRSTSGVVKATVAPPPGSGGAPAASVVSASPDRVVVLLFVNQVTQSTQVSGPRVDLNRVRMTLTRTSEGWKVSIERNSRFSPRRLALVYEERRFTHREYATRVRKLASALYARGARRGDRVAILAMNCSEYLEVYGAAEWAGYTVCTINWRLATPEIEWIVADAKPRC